MALFGIGCTIEWNLFALQIGPFAHSSYRYYCRRVQAGLWLQYSLASDMENRDVNRTYTSGEASMLKQPVHSNMRPRQWPVRRLVAEIHAWSFSSYILKYLKLDGTTPGAMVCAEEHVYPTYPPMAECREYSLLW